MWLDLRYALRTLAKSPGFTAVAITALALGIGANATVFSLLNGILYKNLPFADSDRVLYLSSVNPRSPRGNPEISLPDYNDLRSEVKSFEGLGASTGGRPSISDESGPPEFYRVARVTPNTFPVIGQQAFIGRTFAPDDTLPGAARVVILTYGLWENRYGREPSVIGRKIRVSGESATVIGVMPKGIVFPADTEFWQPLIIDGKAKRGNREYMVFGKLSPGVTRERAQAELATIGQRLAAQYPDTNKDIGFQARSFNDFTVRGPIKTVFLVLMGAVGFVLLIACANVANLMLARAVGRAREISVRTALGASRWRVIRQLLAESLILSLAGGIIAWFIAKWGIRTFDAAVIPTGKPAWIDFSMNYVAFGYLAAISVAAAVLFGLAPALRVSRVDLNTTLKEGSRGAGVGIRGRYLSGVLVVVEMTLAVVLLAGAGLMIRSFLWAYTRPTGVDTRNILTMRFDLPGAKYAKPEQQTAFQKTLVERLRALPGVEAAAVNSQGYSTYELEGKPVDQKSRPGATASLVSDGYFEILRISAQRGRLLAAGDHVAGLPAVVVNRAFATKSWPGEDPIGKRVRLFSGNVPRDWMTVVGTIPDVLQSSQRAEPDPTLYVPFHLEPRQGAGVLARTRVSPASLSQAFRREAQAIDADLPVREVRTLDEQLAQQRWPLRVFGAMFAIFAGIALLLASVGLYAVVAYGVNQRTHEIGVRVALGASSGTILRMVFTNGMRQTAIGLVLGLGAAFGITRVLSTILVGVSPTDPLTFASVGAVLVAAAVLGCAVPARRAMRVDPAIALRHE